MKKALILFLACWSLTAQAAFFNLYDYEAQKWRSAIGTNSGTISGSSYLIGTRFMLRIRAWGVRPLIGRANLYLGDQTNAMLIPIIRDWFVATVAEDQLVAFVSTDYSEATGLTGNTTSKYLAPNKVVPGVALSTHTVNTNCHMANYVRTGSDEATDCMGCSFSSTSSGVVVSNAGNTYCFMGANVTSAADSNGKGFYLCTRTSTTHGRTWKNGTAIVSDNGTDGGVVGGTTIIVHAFNVSGGTPAAFTSRALSYYGMGYGVPDDKVASYTLAVELVQKEVGRSVL